MECNKNRHSTLRYKEVQITKSGLMWKKCISSKFQHIFVWKKLLLDCSHTKMCRNSLIHFGKHKIYAIVFSVYILHLMVTATGHSEGNLKIHNSEGTLTIHGEENLRVLSDVFGYSFMYRKKYSTRQMIRLEPQRNPFHKQSSFFLIIFLRVKIDK